MKTKTKSAPKKKRATKLRARPTIERATAKAEAPRPPDFPPMAHRALMLRTCARDLTAYNGFRWPGVGQYVEAPDWKPEACCGFGLHGLLWGEGDGRLVSWEPDARWLVCLIDEREVVQLDGKIKVPRAWVLFVGDRLGATEYLARPPQGVIRQGAERRAIVGGTATAGDGGTATAGDGGTATAGYGGTATAGDGGTATAGDRGTATAGYGGTATAGERGELRIRWYDGQRYRTGVFYVGEDGVKPNTPYRCMNGKIVEVPRPEVSDAG